MDRFAQFNKKKKLSAFQIIILGFAGMVFVGAGLLMIPAASTSATHFHEALFTAVSSTCVTGLVVKDTATHWTSFGQAVILGLIQVGGLGIITVASAIALFSGRKISLRQRSAIQEAMSAPQLGGLARIIGFVFKWTIIFELAAAGIMMPTFCRDFGARGIWMSIFHSVSCFCNAGFDIMGRPGAEFSSMTYYMTSPLINITLMILIVVGGIGFFTWEDFADHKLRFKKFRMQTKVILVTSAILIFLPMLFFYFSEFSGLATGQRLLNSFFQSITTRTAGFNTANLSAMSEGGKGLTTLLMLIGGSPGSTAGGMKTTTIAVLYANAVAVFRRRDDPQFFGRRVDASAVKNAATILTMYATLFIGGALVINIAEAIPISHCLYETASAVGTVGLTLGLTPTLGIVSRIVIMILMFFGRVGGLTLIYAALSRMEKIPSKLPEEKIIVG
ncbi:MAG: Trk family potassium uptake protein [Firmicutes bacterium]|nr:Trk family potassium uptake protein [Bacillota bacterium]MBR2593591.1 Trk family potassium uptake protein [Bacillota bacterium]